MRLTAVNTVFEKERTKQEWPLLLCPDMNIRRLLRRQHAELRAMLDEVRRCTTERRKIAFEMLNDAVMHHWAVEERHLYPVLEARGYPDTYRSIEEHRALCH